MKEDIIAALEKNPELAGLMALAMESRPEDVLFVTEVLKKLK